MSQPLTWIEISQSAINYNLKQFRKLIGPDKLLMPVIKSNAYGHGFLGIAHICDQNKEVNRICVVNLEEALELIKNHIKKPIMILSFYDFDKTTLKLAIKNNVIFPIYELEQAKILNILAKQQKKKIRVHLEIDTGASRTGVLPKHTLNFIHQLKYYPNLYLEGIWSHFASSEDNPKYTYYQINTFHQVIDNLDKHHISIPLKHMACSASTILYPQSIFNGIRLGLGLYGLYDTPQIQKRIKLKPTLSWYTHIIQIRNLAPGIKIGYGGTYTTKKITKLAIIPVGYWDGYDRSFSNKAQVIINNKKCPIRGRICMNLSMVDATKVSKVKIGDKAILIGKSRTQQITANDLAQWANTINYEIVTRINPQIPRVLKLK